MAIKWFKKKGTKDKGRTLDLELTNTKQTEKNGNDSKPPYEQSMAGQPCEAPAPVASIKEDLPETESKKDNKDVKTGFFGRLKRGLRKTREVLTSDVDALFKGKTALDDDLLEELEELLITSDIGVKTVMDLIERIRSKSSKIKSPEDLKAELKREILSLLDAYTPTEKETSRHNPHVVMIVGVNGVGKTTTVGKLAARMTRQGKSVLISAADTFRAAAIEQLEIWADRAGAQIVKHKENADPAAVAFDSIQAAQSRGIDIVFVDTAGRLHTKINLMEELKKISRSISKNMPGAPHEILLVLDATTGQNALTQAQMFHDALGVTGIALTKLDGSAKGGIVISICNTLNLPLQYIGVGEQIDDLQEFEAKQFVDALF